MNQRGTMARPRRFAAEVALLGYMMSRGWPVARVSQPPQAFRKAGWELVVELRRILRSDPAPTIRAGQASRKQPRCARCGRVADLVAHDGRPLSHGGKCECGSEVKP